jgi:hypothetical protein
MVDGECNIQVEDVALRGRIDVTIPFSKHLVTTV